MSDLEIDRARAQAPHCRVASFSACQQKLRREGVKSPGSAHVIREILREKKIRRAVVPDTFPLGLARELRKLGVKLKPRAAIFQTRNQIRRRGPKNFRRADNGRSRHGRGHGSPAAFKNRPRPQAHLSRLPLTSEKLRAVIDCAILQACGLAANTIVAGGRQACDPHERGHGPLRAMSRSSLIFSRARKRPVTSVTSPARSCADGPVKR